MAGIQNSFTDQEFIDEGLDFFATIQNGNHKYPQA